jgi:transcriptional regulator with XRE-family HTH domain
MPRARKSPTGSPTADFLGRAIAFSGKNQREIAQAVGIGKPNMISMMKLGQTKVPIERIPRLADACGVDPALFMRVALREYQPELLDLVETYVGDLLTLNEIRFVKCYRGVAGADEEIEVDTEVKLAVIGLLQDIRDRRKRRGK